MDVPIPEIHPNEVLVQTKACGICGTDIHMMKGWGYKPTLPHIMGHEPAGVVVKAGESVTSVKPGDRVIPNIFQSCGRCRYCLEGRETLCEALEGIIGVQSQGAFAEYFKTVEQNLFILPDEIDFARGCVIADAVVTAVHAIKNANIAIGENVAVIGAGGVGQNVISLARHRGAEVVAIDVDEEKLSFARKAGAGRSILFTAEEMPRVLKDCAVVMDCVGRNITLSKTLEYAGKGARVIIIGYENETVEIKPQLFAQKELLVRGSRSGTKRDTLEAIQYVRSGILKPHVSDCYRLEDINQAMQKVSEGKAMGRVVITFGEGGERL